jgi:SAM-dependent methyltransferase
MNTEFDRFAARYDELLKDPVRDYFAPGSTFFVTRKIEVLLDAAARLGIDTRRATWIDVGCGQGQLLRAGRPHFAQARGCDISVGMLGRTAEVSEVSDTSDTSIQVVAQTDPVRIPFDDGSADVVTAVCLYHHVPRESRARLTADIRRVLRPGGVFVIVEHNPVNPVVQLIVRRTPVDEHADLLTAATARRLMREAQLSIVDTRYFLYVPERMYRWGRRAEKALEVVPLGGQYAVFARKN